MSFWSRLEKRLTDLAGELLPDDVRDQVERARSMLIEGDAAAAADLLEAVVAARPEHVDALSILGLAELQRGRPREALEAFDRAVARRPDFADAQVGRGQACYALGLDDEAVAAFRAAVEHAGGDREVLALAYRGLGRAHRRAGDLDKAIRELRKAVAESPRDAVALTALGEALHAHPDVSDGEAKKHLGWALEQDQPPPLAHLVSGQIAAIEGRLEDAERHFTRAAEAAEALDQLDLVASALLGGGDVAAAHGDPSEAHQRYLRALELAPRRGDIVARLAELEARAGNVESALERFERAVSLGAGTEVLRRALEVAIGAGQVTRADALAGQLLAVDPRSSAAMVARGRALAAAGDLEGAGAMFRAALEHGADPEAHIARGELALEAGESGEAIDEALAALRLAPAEPRARDLLRAARESELDGGGIGGLRGAFAGLEQLISARPELAHLGGELARAEADWERPLMVTVMGEFSTGKSSFVNAFIGDEVAPTGITPTTATINVVRYGRERGGRIVFLDGAAEEIAWDPLFGRLRDLSEEEARRVSRVEILLPLEVLERVNIVDTPGLNSILPEHEEVARAFISRADAVVWLFAAGQAGKASEREALESIRAQGVRVLGVLNKIDQLSDEDAAAVEAMLGAELGEYLEAVVPVSARRAMGDRSDARWQALERALEERFFTRANKLKASAARRRVGDILGQVRVRGESRRRELEESGVALEAAAERARERAARTRALVAAERRAIASAIGELYRRAAREVIELVLPRRLPFGSNKATPADRDYLISLLEAGFEMTLSQSRRRVVDQLQEVAAELEAPAAAAAALVGAIAADPLARTAEDAARLLEAEVYAAALSFLRGFLRGGNVEQFFRGALPKLDIAEDAVYHALYRDSPDVDQLIDEPLGAAVRRAFSDLAARLETLGRAVSVLGFDLEVGTLEPVARIEANLAVEENPE